MIQYAPHIKRVLDILTSLVALLLLSPAIVLLLISICLESQGGPLFFHWRMGKGLKPFRLIKLRSMRTDKAALNRQFEPGDSRRVTRLGDLLRKTKLDELPELFNILFGDMSLVGPRPEVERYVRIYPSDFKGILKVRPGLSDFASIKYRNEEEILSNMEDPERYYIERILPDKLDLAKKYVKRMSFKTDLEIIGQTIKIVLQKKRKVGVRGRF